MKKFLIILFLALTLNTNAFPHLNEKGDQI